MAQKSPSPGINRSRRRESGQTILLVAVTMAALFAMAALAIDVTTLYIAHSEAQKAADAAALAGAKAFVTTGFTSGGLGDPTTAAAQDLACNGTLGFADLQAKAEAGQNKIAGVAVDPATVTTACDFSNPGDPRITVTVARTGVSTFFARMWGRRGAQVTAVAMAESYNPSGQNVPIQVGSVKPWLIANCDISHAAPGNPVCPPEAYFIDPTTNYAVANAGSFIGESIHLRQVLPNAVPPILGGNYYDLTVPISSTSAACPSASAAWGSCSNLNASAPGYYESVACANSVRLACGSSAPQGVSMYPLVGGILHPPNADQAVQCLIHASGYGADQGQDAIDSSSVPVTIDGGGNNPNPALRTATDISRSDSVVTVPIGDCPLGSLFCTPFNIVGFMQLGIKEIDAPRLLVNPGNIRAVILNVSGCGDAAAPPAVSGGGVAPVPVRLIH